MLKNLWVIDVQERRLTRATEDYRFFALSYVYGGIRIVQDGFLHHSLRCPLRTYNFSTGLRELLGLQSECTCAWYHLLDNLPQTIEDTILPVSLLRFKHLWVDVLCLNLQDAESQSKSINAMNTI